jgi:WD40 repeat protein
MCFNQRRTEIAVISSNGFIHCWDASRFKQIMSKKLPHTTENVCLAVDEDSLMYAVGSKANTDLLDARTLQVLQD